MKKKISHVPLWLNDFCLAHLWSIPARSFVLLHLFIITAATIRLSPFFLLIPDTPDCWSLALGNVIFNSQVWSLLWSEELLFIHRHRNSLSSGKTCGGAGIEHNFLLHQPWITVTAVNPVTLSKQGARGEKNGQDFRSAASSCTLMCIL